jgi:type IV pilus assembly protein PilM
MGLFNLFGKKKSILGVDIGTTNIKVAQVTHGASAVLDTYGIVNCSYQISGRKDATAVKQMASVLKSLVQKAGVTASRCVISLPNSSVFTSVLEMPKMSDSELATAVEFEAKKYVPLALSEIDLSWSIVGQSNNCFSKTNHRKLQRSLSFSRA